MPYDLQAMMRMDNPRRRTSVTLAPIQPTLEHILRLTGILTRLGPVWREATFSRVLPALRDPAVTTDTLRAEWRVVMGATSPLMLEQETKVRDWAVRLERWHRKQWVKRVAAGGKVDVSFSLLSPRDTVDAGAEQVLALMGSLQDDLEARIAGEMWRAYQLQGRTTAFSAAVVAIARASKERATVIADDQTRKMFAALDRTRFEEAGLPSFVWQASGLKSEHLARDGQTYSWRRLPADGGPAARPRCKCLARALIPA